MGRCPRRDARRRFAEIHRAARPVDAGRDRARQEDDQEKQVSEILQQREGEYIEADIMSESLLRVAKGETIDRFEISIPTSGLALRGENRENRRCRRYDRPPGYAVAEGPHEFRQIDFADVVRPPDDA